MHPSTLGSNGAAGPVLEASPGETAAHLADLAQPALRPLRHEAPVVGVLQELDEQGTPLVLFPGAGEQALAARSVVPLDHGAVGREVVLLFEQGDPARPLVMGVLQPARPASARAALDGERVVLTAEREIVLRCGAASITLTRCGKVLIEGAYVVTKSAGLNRIKGAAVQIN